MEKKVGLVFGGGGARSFIHLGVYDELIDSGIKVNYIVSSSMGSLIGALIAGGVPTDKIKKEFYRVVMRVNWLKPIISKKGFFSQSNIRKILINLIDSASFEELKIPITMVSTDLSEGREVLLESGNVVDAVCASSAFPGIYKPVVINNKLLADGGILNNVPADICREKIGNDSVVITSSLEGKFDTSFESLNNSFQVLWRSIYIPIIKSRDRIVRENSDIILNPLKDTYLSFNTWRDIFKFYNPKIMESFYQKGREEARNQIPKIKELISGANS